MSFFSLNIADIEGKQAKFNNLKGKKAFLCVNVAT